MPLKSPLTCLPLKNLRDSHFSENCLEPKLAMHRANSSGTILRLLSERAGATCLTSLLAVDMPSYRDEWLVACV